MSLATLTAFADALSRGTIRTIDLTQPLSEDTPVLVLPEPFGQTAPFTRREISRYDDRGVAWHWNNFTVGEHTGTHFDAPVHWVTGRDLPRNTVDAIAPADFIAPAVVIDVAAQAAADPDKGESQPGRTFPDVCLAHFFPPTAPRCRPRRHPNRQDA